ncbi:MAG: glycosyltransferase family 2 protein [Rhabdochlamydiaceae bacterium]|nr:glycosyltransferase family 2 protein [Candidatus Amphrikana amoebophyrae]
MTFFKSKYFIICLVSLLLTGGALMGLSRQQLRKDRTTYNHAVKVVNPAEIKPFVVVISSYNNAEYVERNLESALSQVYSNYRVIFIDDASTDDNYSLAKSVIDRLDANDRVTLIHNGSNRGAMANTVRAVNLCNNEEIVVMLDGDDTFIGPNVLTTLNQYYNHSDTWITYGRCIENTTGNFGFSKPISHLILKAGSIKRKAWMVSHPFTFYAGLFKKIKLEDFSYKGKFLPTATDVAAMLPMIEMARLHTFFINEPLYEYNLENPKNDHKISKEKQEFYNQYVRHLRRYQALSTPPWETHMNEESDVTDIIAFSWNRPLQVYAMLESLYEKGKNFGQVFVIYRSSNSEFDKGYNEVMKKFPRVQFVRQDDALARQVFKPLVMKYTFDESISKAKYIAYSTDDLVLREELDFAVGVKALQDFKASGFFYRLGKNIDHCYMYNNLHTPVPHLMPLDNDIYAWQFKNGTGDWDYPHSVDFTLYSKEFIKPHLESFHFTYPNDFEAVWAQKADHDRLGLCHSSSKIINMPLNVISNKTNRGMRVDEYKPEALLYKFNQGLKMDRKPLETITPNAPHMDYHPTFVMRMD